MTLKQQLKPQFADITDDSDLWMTIKRQIKHIL